MTVPAVLTLLVTATPRTLLRLSRLHAWARTHAPSTWTSICSTRTALHLTRAWQSMQSAAQERDPGHSKPPQLSSPPPVLSSRTSPAPWISSELEPSQPGLSPVLTSSLPVVRTASLVPRSLAPRLVRPSSGAWLPRTAAVTDPCLVWTRSRVRLCTLWSTTCPHPPSAPTLRWSGLLPRLWSSPLPLSPRTTAIPSTTSTCFSTPRMSSVLPHSP
mmetsp:Transcript_12169/g.14477  ORF Transcript_12169/g.14477 Transcript_12169/m.14477 type:complete len:216 (-) Transcript_12169:2738-3385(-)